MTDDHHLTLEACRALTALGYPQGTDREPSTLLRWVDFQDSAGDGAGNHLTANTGWRSPWYACPDSHAALTWLRTKEVTFSVHHTGYWWGRPWESYPPRHGPFMSPSELILDVAKALP